MMEHDKLFLLLDIDGVLLEAHGYRLAAVDTINDFLRQMGQPDLRISRTVTDAYEANGISAEWDMVPLTLAAFISRYIERAGECPEWDAFPPRCDRLHLNDSAALERMMLEQIAEYAALLDPAVNVIDALGKAFAAGKIRGLRALYETGKGGCFFTDTLDPWKAPFFAQLMCRIIGSAEYEKFYEMPAPVRCEAYLETKDRPLLSEHYRAQLPEISGRSVRAAIMTYRPTLLPVWDGNNRALWYVNTPDGECALRLLGWTDGRIPMVGSGSLCYIEDKYGLRREHYVKPHPFHALAAMMRTLRADETEALECVRLLCEADPKHDPNPAAAYLPPESRIRLAIFEDSVSGILCAKNAAAVLRSWGYSVRALLCGIRTTAEKNERLFREGAELYGDVNEALDRVLLDGERNYL